MGLPNSKTQISEFFILSVFLFQVFPFVTAKVATVRIQANKQQNALAAPILHQPPHHTSKPHARHPKATVSVANWSLQVQPPVNLPTRVVPPVTLPTRVVPPASLPNPDVPPAAAHSPPTFLSQVDDQEFLSAHNAVRVHFGEPLFTWDSTLAAYARMWAAKRVGDCRLVHSFGPYGENIFWGGRNHWTAKEVVQSWVNEYKYYNRKTNECQAGKLCGHYTQVVWRDSNKVGCARVQCLNGGLFAICSYNPPGNYENENPFVHTVTDEDKQPSPV